MSHPLWAHEPAQHDDEHLPARPPAGDRQLASDEDQIVPAGGSHGNDARGAPADPHDDRCGPGPRGAPTGGVPSPSAAGSTNAEHETAPLLAARAGDSTETPVAGRQARPIRRENVYTERMMQGGGDVSATREDRHEPVSRCARCEDTGRTCHACVQRRHRAWKLVDRDGRTIEEAAAVLRLPTASVRVLVAHERDRLELGEYRINSIPTARARAFLEREMQRDPSLTRAEVAHRMNMTQADFDRQFGYAAAKKTNGATQQRVGIPLASNLALALGRAPHDLDGC
jgi:hypothetical protein